MYTYVCIYSHCCRCCATCVRFGALFSGQRRSVFLCRDAGMYLRSRGCPVVLEIELSVSAWYRKTRRALLRARRLLLLLLTAAACGVQHNVQTDIHLSGKKMAILCQSEHQKIAPHPKHPRLKNIFFSSRNPMSLLAAAINTEGDTSGMPSMQPTEHPRTSPPGSRVSEHMPLYLSGVHLPE